MKNIYQLITLGIVVMLIVTNFMCGAGNLASLSSPKYTLYPPTNLQVVPIEACYANLSWDKPHDPGGLPPAGLLGYRIYREGLLIHPISDPDSLSYFDFIDFAGLYTDSITAWYDLTSYGFPGDFGESAATSANSFSSCEQILPFSEPWDGGSFGYQQWSFIPDQGNWVLNTSIGNPTPTATFTGTPAITNYEKTLRSISLSGNINACADFYFEFDSRVIINNPTSQEKLIVEVYYNGTWYPKDTLVNDSSTGWVHHKIDIPDVAGKVFFIGFRATGINSTDIAEWDVDNIQIYYVCIKPPDFNLHKTDNVVHLSWGIPCTGKKYSPHQNDSSVLVGYNIFRDEFGLPYIKINTLIITDTTYDDVLPGGNVLKFCYFVTAIYQDPNNPGQTVCEPMSDTLCAGFAAGISNENHAQIRIFPNPVEDNLKIESAEPITGVEILNLLGDKVYSDCFTGKKNVNIQFESYPSGIYVVKIKGKDGLIVRKVIKD